MSSNSAFHEIRQPCIELSRLAFLPKQVFDPNSVPLLNALKQVELKLSEFTQTNDREEQFTPNFADYVFTPIASLLKQESLGDVQVQYILLIISHLLNLCWSKTGSFQKELSRQLFPIITFLINASQVEEEIEKKSLDFKRISAQILDQFFKSLNCQPYSGQFFIAENGTLPSLAYSVTILLTILLKTPQDSTTQLSCLDALSILYNDILSDGETLSYILPGNVSKFAKLLALPGRNINSKVVCSTLGLLGTLLVMVYDDIYLKVHIEELQKITDITEENGEIKEFSNEVTVYESSMGTKKHRTTSWLRATSSQVKLALRSFVPKLLRRNNETINEALVQFATSLLQKSSKSLVNCQLLLVEILIELKSDPGLQLLTHMNKVKEYVHNDVKKLKTNVQFNSSKYIESLEFAISILYKNSTEDEIMIESIVQNILDSLDANNEANKLTLSFNSNQDSDKIVEQSSNVIISDQFNLNKTTSSKQIIFNKLTKEMETSLTSMLMNIGKTISQNQAVSGDLLGKLVENLISEQSTSNLTRKTITLWISSWLIKGTEDIQKISETSVVDDFLTFEDQNTIDSASQNSSACYVALEFCNDLSQEIASTMEGSTITKQQESAICTVLSSIEIISGVMKEEFEDELIDYLYVVVENLASSSQLVRQFAQSCSMSIANGLYDGSVSELISQNMDYLVDAISTRLNSGMTDRVSTVLMVVYKLVGYKAVESFRDILETIFKLIDYYHGYAELCLQFFQLFKVIVIEMGHTYLKDDLSKALGDEHIVKSTFSPWGMTNMSQLLSVLDKEHEKKELISRKQEFEFDENDPKNFQEYFDQKLHDMQADSDDEDEDEQSDEYKAPDAKPDENDSADTWVSPIPLESYKILLQIFSYGDRLLKHNSKQLRVQILEVNKLIVSLLATQYNSLLPQVAKIWDSIVVCCLDKDLSIVKPACELITELLHYSSDFLSKRFVDLWYQMQKESALLHEVKTLDDVHIDTENVLSCADKMKVTLSRQFPPLTRGALISLSNMLLEGISFTEMFLPEVTLETMIYCCIHVIPKQKISSRSLVLGDIIWKITNIA